VNDSGEKGEDGATVKDLREEIALQNQELKEVLGIVSKLRNRTFTI